MCFIFVKLHFYDLWNQKATFSASLVPSGVNDVSSGVAKMGFPTRQGDGEEAKFRVMVFSYWTVRQPLSKAPLHHDIDLECFKQLILIVGVVFRAGLLCLSMESHL